MGKKSHKKEHKKKTSKKTKQVSCNQNVNGIYY